MLHLIAENRLPQAIADRIAAGDDVMLQAGAIWAAFEGHEDSPRLNELMGRGCRIYALRDLLAAAGIGEDRLLQGVQAIDYAAFVELTVKNPVIQTWR